MVAFEMPSRKGQSQPARALTFLPGFISPSRCELLWWQGTLWAGSQLKYILMILNSLSSLKFYNIISLIYFPCLLLSKIIKSYHLLPSIMDTFSTQTLLPVKLSLHFLLLFIAFVCFLSMIFVLVLLTTFMR